VIYTFPLLENLFLFLSNFLSVHPFNPFQKEFLHKVIHKLWHLMTIHHIFHLMFLIPTTIMVTYTKGIPSNFLKKMIFSENKKKLKNLIFNSSSMLSRILENPKSAILNILLWIRILAGFKSLWIILSSCKI